jgi:hypothetical protein
MMRCAQNESGTGHSDGAERDKPIFDLVAAQVDPNRLLADKMPVNSVISERSLCSRQAIDLLVVLIFRASMSFPVAIRCCAVTIPGFRPLGAAFKA